MGKSYYKHGDWNAICDVCGRKFKSSKLKERWDGLMVCREDFEYRHPQDFIRSVPDQFPLPWVRDEAADVEVAGLYVEGDYVDGGYIGFT